MGQEEVLPISPTLINKEKMYADDVTFSEMVFGVPPSLFEHIKLSKSTKKIWDTLKHLFKDSENMKENRLTSVVNKYNTFYTSSGEYVAAASNRYRILLNNLTTHGVT